MKVISKIVLISLLSKEIHGQDEEEEDAVVEKTQVQPGVICS